MPGLHGPLPRHRIQITHGKTHYDATNESIPSICHQPTSFLDFENLKATSHKLLTVVQSCITEDQKYQGALYREKPSKASKRKSVSLVEPGSHNALVPRNAYVEDDPEGDVPPAVPEPPSAIPAQAVEPVNVFDYLVHEDTPNASRTSLGGSREPMTMKKDAPAVFTEAKGDRALAGAEYKNKEEQAHDESYNEHGFSYGAEPVKPITFPNPNGSVISLDFMTPSAKATRAKLDRIERPGHSRTNSVNTI